LINWVSSHGQQIFLTLTRVINRSAVIQRRIDFIKLRVNHVTVRVDCGATTWRDGGVVRVEERVVFVSVDWVRDVCNIVVVIVHSARSAGGVHIQYSAIIVCICNVQVSIGKDGTIVKVIFFTN
jgi:hypothetical protein